MIEGVSTTVAIPTYMREAVLLETLDQVLSLEPSPDSVMVVDQTPRHAEETQERLRALASDGLISLTRLASPGLTHARNVALLHCSTDVVAYLDDDVLLPRDWLANHARHYQDAAVTAVVGQLYWRKPGDHSLDAAHPAFGTIPSFVPGPPRKVGFLRGGNMSVRRDWARAVGGFDEAMVGTASYEENEFAYRLTKAGGTILLDTDAYVIHLAFPTGGCRSTQTPAFTAGHNSTNLFLFAFRHLAGNRESFKILRDACRLPLAGTRHRPWLWPARGSVVILAAVRGFILSRRRPRSPWSDGRRSRRSE